MQQTSSRSGGADGKRFRHFTLTGGPVAMQARSDVADAVVAILRPIVQVGSDPPPGLPGPFLDLRFPQDLQGARVPGRASFHVGTQSRGSSPPLMAVACWRDDASSQAWEACL